MLGAARSGRGANLAAPSSDKQWGEMIAIDPIVGLPRSLRGNTYCYMIRSSNPKISQAKN